MNDEFEFPTIPPGSTPIEHASRIADRLDEFLEHVAEYPDAERLHFADSGGLTLGEVRQIRLALLGLISSACFPEERLVWRHQVWSVEKEPRPAAA